MTALWVLGGIVAWLLIGIATGRVMYVTGAFENEDPDSLAWVAIGTVVLWPLAWVVGLLAGIYRLVTAPTRRQRLERKQERADREAAKVRRAAAEYGLPTVD